MQGPRFGGKSEAANHEAHPYDMNTHSMCENAFVWRSWWPAHNVAFSRFGT